MELLSMVFNHSRQAMVITNRQGNILRVNAAFTEVTGYTAEEAIGNTPRILKSRRQDEQFYKNFWQSLLEKGEWAGKIWNRKKSGEGYACHLRVSSIMNEQGEICYFLGVSDDITQQMLAQDDDSQPDNIDILTELPNRRLFREKFAHSLRQAQLYGGQVALLLLDLDDFRRVNGTLGHQTGDSLLRLVAQRIVEALRKVDIAARLEQDEFAIGVVDIRDTADVKQIAQKLIEAIAEPILHDGTPVALGASIGASIFPDDGNTVDELFQCADIAMNRAKVSGKNQCQFFDLAIAEQIARRFALVSDLRNAVPGQLFVLYQPQMDIASGIITGVEALVRWQHPERGLMGPDQFIPLAEETGLIHRLGVWVLETACRQAAHWFHVKGVPIRVAVNVSANQLCFSDFGETVVSVIKRCNLPPELLELELTETTVMAYPDEAARLFRNLKELGINIAMDDFGTGYSSLACLKRLPLSCLKIDRSFFHDIPEDKNDTSIVRTIIEIAHCLNLRAVAEGIETNDQLAFLRQRKCDKFQGYLLAKPLHSSELECLLDRQPHLRHPFSQAKQEAVATISECITEAGQQPEH